MHGLILSELKHFAEATFGNEAWPVLLQDAGLGQRMYMAGEIYPDAEVVAIVGAAARRAGADPQTILEQFGEFIAPTLMRVYKPYIKPAWKTLDMIEHTEENIHRAVRLRDPGAAPPELKVRRLSPSEIVIIYQSDRKMCALARGITRGVAKHYNEKVEITDLTCMLKGKPTCTIAVKQIPNP
jgi:predicted hydrocarbon binding protein